MAGSGSWQNLLPDTASKQLYAAIYPDGISLSELDDHYRPLIQDWHRGHIIRLEDQHIIPIGPVITDGDLDILDPWLRDISDTMCAAVSEHLEEYRIQAMNLAKNGIFPRKKYERKGYEQEKYENVLTIQICAHTLDSWVFSQLRREMMGTYSPRGSAGTFFFWGYAFSSGAKRIFGFSTYGGRSGLRLHVLRSHGLDREQLKAVLRRYDTHNLLKKLYFGDQGSHSSTSDRPPYSHDEEDLLQLMRKVHILEPEDPPRIAIPIFTNKEMASAVTLYQKVTEKIVLRFRAQMPELKILIEMSSFSRCLWSDICCMLFHLAYSYGADQLVERGIIPEFPQSAGAEWGVWIH